MLALLISVMAITPLKGHSQDDVPVSDEEIILPTSSSDSDSPPLIIDESDSNEVPDVEDYDG